MTKAFSIFSQFDLGLPSMSRWFSWEFLILNVGRWSSFCVIYHKSPYLLPADSGSGVARSIIPPAPYLNYLNCGEPDNWWWWSQDQGSNNVDLRGGLCLWGEARRVLTSVNQPIPNHKKPPYSLNMWIWSQSTFGNLGNHQYYVLTVLIVGSLCKVRLIKLSFPLPQTLIQSWTCLNKWRILSTAEFSTFWMTKTRMMRILLGGRGRTCFTGVFKLFPWLSTFVCSPSE